MGMGRLHLLGLKYAYSFAPTTTWELSPSSPALRPRRLSPVCFACAAFSGWMLSRSPSCTYTPVSGLTVPTRWRYSSWTAAGMFSKISRGTQALLESWKGPAEEPNSTDSHHGAYLGTRQSWLQLKAYYQSDGAYLTTTATRGLGALFGAIECHSLASMTSTEPAGAVACSSPGIGMRLSIPSSTTSGLRGSLPVDPLLTPVLHTF